MLVIKLFSTELITKKSMEYCSKYSVNYNEDSIWRVILNFNIILGGYKSKVLFNLGFAAGRVCLSDLNY